MVALTD